MNKTDIEKAVEIAKSCIRVGDNYIVALATAPFEAAIKMAAWKEEKMIEKASEWVKKNLIHRQESPLAIFNLLDDFKKAMKQ